jgi:carbamoyl-phosphate synthase large subunit
MSHIERAGVHSGDSFAVYPGRNLYPADIETIVEYTTRIGLGLGVRGLMNVQYVIFGARIYVLEVNPRSSRTVPFLSKVTGVPMIHLATNIMLGRSLQEQGYAGGLWPAQPLVAVKAPVFSMAKLRGVEVGLGPEMKSTGEVMGIDHDFPAALYKAMVAAGLEIPPGSSLLLSLADEDKAAGLPTIRTLAELGCRLYATEGTAAFIEREGLPVRAVRRIGAGTPNVLDIIRDSTVRAVINTPGRDHRTVSDGFEIRRAAVEAAIPCLTSLDTASAVAQAMRDAAGAYTVQPLVDYRRTGHLGY